MSARPAFQIERSRNGQWTAHLVASNGEVTWVSEQFTTLGKAEESLFHVAEEVCTLLEVAHGMPDDGWWEAIIAIPYDLSVAYTRGERDYEARVAHRAVSDA
jgi:uncharacterized protein YegP (UPF0339 family)